MMYTFYKYNPRTEPGHRDGDLGSPPAPGFGGHGDDFNSEPLIILGGAFLVVAVALCLFGAASHARRQLSYMSVIKCAPEFPWFFTPVRVCPDARCGVCVLERRGKGERREKRGASTASCGGATGGSIVTKRNAQP